MVELGVARLQFSSAGVQFALAAFQLFSSLLQQFQRLLALSLRFPLCGLPLLLPLVDGLAKFPQGLLLLGKLIGLLLNATGKRFVIARADGVQPRGQFVPTSVVALGKLLALTIDFLELFVALLSQGIGDAASLLLSIRSGGGQLFLLVAQLRSLGLKLFLQGIEPLSLGFMFASREVECVAVVAQLLLGGLDILLARKQFPQALLNLFALSRGLVEELFLLGLGLFLKNLPLAVAMLDRLAELFERFLFPGKMFRLLLDSQRSRFAVAAFVFDCRKQRLDAFGQLRFNAIDAPSLRGHELSNSVSLLSKRAVYLFGQVFTARLRQRGSFHNYGSVGRWCEEHP